VLNFEQFLFEGLLKVPPVLSQDIKDYGLGVVIWEAVNKLKYHITKNEQLLSSIPDTFNPKHVEFLTKETLDLCKQLEPYTPVREPSDENQKNEWEEEIYLGRRYQRYVNVDRPTVIEHLKVTKFYSYDSDEITFKVILVGLKEKDNNEYEFNERNGSISTYELSSMFENELNPSYYKEGVRDYQNFYRGYRGKTRRNI
jgi:hypothetical protein